LRRGYFNARAWITNPQCEKISFTPAFPNPDPINVQVSASHRGSVGQEPHGATNVWVEDINPSGFRACVNDVYKRPHDGNLYFEWLAFQNISSGVMDEIALPPWSGTTCKVVNFPSLFTQVPSLLATINHRESGW
jgi:hypothetical protein